MRKNSFPHFARYEISGIIGQGGMGAVYKAYHRILKRSVALKVPHPALLQDSTSRERFLREAQVLGRLQHPHIVSVYDADVEDGRPYIAMQFVAGQTLSDRISRGTRLSQTQVVAWCTQIADALEYLHGMGVLHRDLKSSNVLISEDGNALITDFGIAHLEAQTTITNGLLGTPAYMSPEQAAGRRVDARSDIYSLGIILYESLAGSLPFKDENSLALIQKILHEKPPDLRGLRPDAPDWLANITHRCIHKKPERRFQTGNALASALQKGNTAGVSQAPTVSDAWHRAKPAISNSIKKHTKNVDKKLVRLRRWTREFMIRSVRSSPTYSPLDRMTGLLRPSRTQIDLLDLAHHPVILAAIVFGCLINLPGPRRDAGSGLEEGPVIQQADPSEKPDSAGVTGKKPGWQPWPSKP